MTSKAIPALYPIADAGLLAAGGIRLSKFAAGLKAAGADLVQYRDKAGAPADVLRAAAILQGLFAGTGCRLILNDRVDLAVLAGFDGVHVGQEDLSPDDARRMLSGAKEQAREAAAAMVRAKDCIVGISTHTEAQLLAADASSADYIAIGPVFATGTKLNPDPVVGLERVRRARALTRKPLVAIGGITRANARSVIDAGADSVAVISGLFAPGESIAQVVRDFLDILR